MLKKPITFTDFEGATRTETFYFNINEVEIAEMALLHENGPEGAAEFFKELGDSKDPKKILPAMKNIIALAVGERVGEFGFNKEGVADWFMTSPAFSALFMELVQDESGRKIAEFFRGILPGDIARGFGTEDAILPKHSMAELIAMSDDEFDKVAGTDIRNMSRIHLSAAMERRVRKSNDAGTDALESPNI